MVGLLTLRREIVFVDGVLFRFSQQKLYVKVHVTSVSSDVSFYRGSSRLDLWLLRNRAPLLFSQIVNKRVHPYYEFVGGRNVSL